MKDQAKVMYDSPEAARKVIMTLDGKEISMGYLSIDNRFYNDEDLARYASATHKICECGNEMKKGYTKCNACIDKQRTERYSALPEKVYDGSPVCFHDGEPYFFYEEDIDEYCEDNEQSKDALMLVFCEENKYSEIRSDYWQDDLPEEGELPDSLQKMVDELNKHITTLPPSSYSPGKVRVKF